MLRQNGPSESRHRRNCAAARKSALARINARKLCQHRRCYDRWCCRRRVYRCSGAVCRGLAFARVRALTLGPAIPNVWRLQLSDHAAEGAGQVLSILKDPGVEGADVGKHSGCKRPPAVHHLLHTPRGSFRRLPISLVALHLLAPVAPKLIIDLAPLRAPLQELNLAVVVSLFRPHLVPLGESRGCLIHTPLGALHQLLQVAHVRGRGVQLLGHGRQQLLQMLDLLIAHGTTGVQRPRALEEEGWRALEHGGRLQDGVGEAGDRLEKGVEVCQLIVMPLESGPQRLASGFRLRLCLPIPNAGRLLRESDQRVLQRALDQPQRSAAAVAEVSREDRRFRDRGGDQRPTAQRGLRANPPGSRRAPRERPQASVHVCARGKG
mmetsp:Transcript_141393/g.451930  ORF Transcript_141393/g.451930 Transcript_141393/m.451930 type:complete len:379 (+) Transcript_141393:255-1391(+)